MTSEPQSLTPNEATLLERSTLRTLADVAEMGGLLRARCQAAVQGRDDVIDLILVALFGDGHVLLEDYPGSGKTTLAKALGESILPGVSSALEAVPGLEDEDTRLRPFRRVQFTPDLLPSDITGVAIFDPEANRFSFRPGPVFAHVLLADEINRTSPKVQAALLEAMGEKQVTADGATYGLDELFFVIATQNPLDLVGTYPLPLAQLDRFMFKIRMTHLARDAELDVLSRWQRHRTPPNLPRVSRDDIVAARVLVSRDVQISPRIREALVDLARGIRADRRVLQGVSTRALVLAMPAMQARAMLHGRDYVSSDDLEALLIPLMAHRVEVVPGVDDAAEVIKEASAEAMEALSRATLRRS